MAIKSKSQLANDPPLSGISIEAPELTPLEKPFTETNNADSEEFMTGLGLSFLEGAASNSSITVEQRASLKALEAIVNSITIASQQAQSSGAPEAAQSAGILDGIKGLFT